MFRFLVVCIVVLVAGQMVYAADEPADLPTREDVEAALFDTISAFHALSVQGGHANSYSADLKTRYDGSHLEYGPISAPDQIEMEPPATPWIGRAILRAYRATGEERYLRMAGEIADALAKVQAESSGWPARARLGGARAKTSDMDDNRSQSCVLFLVELAAEEAPPGHREVMERGLDFLLKAQYPSGGWPQRYPPPEDQDDYRRYHTLNDATIPDCMRTLLAAYHVLGEQRYLDAVLRAADWLVAVQLPEPQAGWAQQYYDDFVTGPLIPNGPAPGRWFEPTAVAALETVAVVDILVEVWLESGDQRYTTAMAKAGRWLDASRLPDGRWARLYELCTNRPLYCTPDRVITYSDQNLRPGYGWKGNWGASDAIRLAPQVRKLGHKAVLAQRNARPTANRVRELGTKARAIIDSLEDRGLWVGEGFHSNQREQRIWSGLFCDNVAHLCAYLEGLKARER